MLNKYLKYKKKYLEAQKKKKGKKKISPTEQYATNLDESNRQKASFFKDVSISSGKKLTKDKTTETLLTNINGVLGELQKNKVVCLQGPTGSGKTHLLRLMIQAGLITDVEIGLPRKTLVDETFKKLIAQNVICYRRTGEHVPPNQDEFKQLKEEFKSKAKIDLEPLYRKAQYGVSISTLLSLRNDLLRKLIICNQEICNPNRTELNKCNRNLTYYGGSASVVEKIIVIDEAHVDSSEMQQLLSLAYMLYTLGKIKIILLTATPSLFLNQFFNDSLSILKLPPRGKMLRLPMKSLNIKSTNLFAGLPKSSNVAIVEFIKYCKSIKKMDNYSYLTAGILINNVLMQDVKPIPKTDLIKSVSENIKFIDENSLIDLLFYKLDNPLVTPLIKYLISGITMVFFPTINSMERKTTASLRIYEKYNKLFPNYPFTIKSIDSSTRDQVVDAPNQLYFTTNALEVGIDLNNCRVVIPGNESFESRNYFGLNYIDFSTISQSSIDQQRGRCGRNKDISPLGIYTSNDESIVQTAVIYPKTVFSLLYIKNMCSPNGQNLLPLDAVFELFKKIRKEQDYRSSNESANESANEVDISKVSLEDESKNEAVDSNAFDSSSGDSSSVAASGKASPADLFKTQRLTKKVIKRHLSELAGQKRKIKMAFKSLESDSDTEAHILRLKDINEKMAFLKKMQKKKPKANSLKKEALKKEASVESLKKEASADSLENEEPKNIFSTVITINKMKQDLINLGYLDSQFRPIALGNVWDYSRSDNYANHLLELKKKKSKNGSLLILIDVICFILNSSRRNIAVEYNKLNKQDMLEGVDTLLEHILITLRIIKSGHAKIYINPSNRKKYIPAFEEFEKYLRTTKIKIKKRTFPLLNLLQKIDIPQIYQSEIQPLLMYASLKVRETFGISKTPFYTPVLSINLQQRSENNIFQIPSASTDLGRIQTAIKNLHAGLDIKKIKALSDEMNKE